MRDLVHISYMVSPTRALIGCLTPSFLTLLKSDVTRRDHVVHCHGSQECWFTFCQCRCQFHSRRHSLRITLKSTILVHMCSSYAWTRKSWQGSEWPLDFNSVFCTDDRSANRVRDFGKNEKMRGVVHAQIDFCIRLPSQIMSVTDYSPRCGPNIGLLFMR